jgi:hypothetical protein
MARNLGGGETAGEVSLLHPDGLSLDHFFERDRCWERVSRCGMISGGPVPPAPLAGALTGERIARSALGIDSPNVRRPVVAVGANVSTIEAAGSSESAG